KDDGRRRIRARSERLGHGAAHQGRWIVEQHDERAFSGDTVVNGKIGMEEGAGERAGRIGTLARGGSAHPLEEMSNDHAVADTTPHPGKPRALTLRRRALTKRSP